VSSEAAVVEEQHGRVLVLRLDRPEARNALDFASLHGLDAGLQRAADDPAVGAVVVTGSGDRTFCAGMDLSEQGPPPGDTDVWQGR